MGKVSLEDLDKYGNSGNSSFFKLVKDKDTAQVRILVDKPEDISDYIYAVHEVKLPDAKYGRDVNCLRAYNEPLDECPFCAAGRPAKPKLYLPLYNMDSEEIQIWTRGKGFISKLSSFISRYSKPSVVANIIEIERNGKEGDMKTTYELYPVDKDDVELEEFGDVPEPLGGVLMDKSAEDMEYYLDNGDFPDSDEQENERPVRREKSSSRRSRQVEADSEEEEEEQPRRRRSESSKEDRSTRRSRRRPDDDDEDY